MKTLNILLLFSALISSHVYSQSDYEAYPEYQDPILEDEGSYNSELQPPLADDYYLSEELERQEDYSYEEEPQDWSLEGEELPVDDYESY